MRTRAAPLKITYPYSLLILILSGLFIQCQSPINKANSDKVDFNFDIRPILVKNCYLCHGPDSTGRKAGLRLDTYEGATAWLKDSSRAIVPGSSKSSELIRRITHQDPSEMMPPPESNFALTEHQIALLEKWIDQGAEWKKYWAFLNPETVTPPEYSGSGNEIDGFIDKKLGELGLEKAATASKHSILRRTSYLLTGLPPTPEMVTSFTGKQDDRAYESMVDYYLNSPAFGERWARHWMDIVRYAETRGHEFDYSILGAWRYRDYLIRAFNDDVPYDQIVREHLAGDLLPSSRWSKDGIRNESLLGTTFFTLSEGTHSPVDIRKDEADRIDNIIDVTSKSFLGLTVACARCHDHKFDPIPTKDYYAMYGMIESSRFTPVSAEMTLEKLSTVSKINELDKQIQAIISKGQSPGMNSELPGKEVESPSDFVILGDFRAATLANWKSDGLAFGQTTTLGKPVFNHSGELIKFDSGKASSKILSEGVFGALRSPDFTIDKDYIGLRIKGRKSTVRIIIDNFQLIQNPIYGELEKKINSEKWKELQIDVSAWKGHKAYVEILPGEYATHVYGQPENSYVEAEYVIAYDSKWPEKIPAAESPQIKRVKVLNELLAKNQLTARSAELASLLASRKKLAHSLKDSLFFSGVADGFSINSKVFIRGNHKELSAEQVPKMFLKALTEQQTPFESNGSGRLEFADYVVSSENPLTARVMVNRIWHHIFGRGLVETVDNFGMQGALPSHPELLDYLAIKFQDEGWSIKRIIKHILMSDTYRRTTQGSISDRDPTNKYLSFFPLRRLEAEAIRDAMLSASGNLNDQMYGEPVPVHLTPFMQGRGRPGKSGPLDGNGRRSIYLAVRRNFLEPMMITFDRPIPFSTFGNRNETNVPAQSLILMNDPFVIQQAELLADAVLAEQTLSKEDRIRTIYLRSLSRAPSSIELEKGNELLQSLAGSYELDEGEFENSRKVWQEFCHSIFNLKEFIYLI